MAEQTSSANSSLPLHEVLEAEFAALHGKPLQVANDSSSSNRETRLKALWAAVHSEKRSALCLSGGGIRSATFGLGVLQGLARCGLLEKFDYLSTVSGGGYIGSWLSAWIKKNPHGIQGVLTELKRPAGAPLDSEPQPIRHLREFSNYLAPRSGLTSVDFWTLIVTFIRNMFLNWLVMISWLAVAIMIPRLYLVPLYFHPDWIDEGGRFRARSDATFSEDWKVWVDSMLRWWHNGLAVLLMIGFVLAAGAIAYAIIDLPSTGDSRLPQHRFLKFRHLPLVLASVFLAAWWALFRSVDGSGSFTTIQWLLKFVAFTVASYFSGALLSTAFPSFRKRKQQAGRLWRFVAATISAALAGVCLWAFATRMFLDPQTIKFQNGCEAIDIPIKQEPPPKVAIHSDSRWVLIQRSRVPIKKQIEIRSRCDAIQIPSRKEITIEPGSRLSPATNVDALRLPAPATHVLNYVCFAPPLILTVMLLANFVFTGLTSGVSKDEDREWWSRWAAWILITILAWIAVNIVVLWGAQAISAAQKDQFGVFLGDIGARPQTKTLLSAFGVVAGIAGGLLALRSKLIHILGPKKSFHWLLIAVGIVFFVLLAVVISWLLLLVCSLPLVRTVTGFLYPSHIYSWGTTFLIISSCVTFAILLVGIVMGFFINANTFSLHATYRNRLIRAYLAAFRVTRRAHLLTGVDPADDFRLHELSSGKPFHVINGALNLVHGEELAWQERKAESFTMSRLHSGSIEVGYRPSAEYGGGITLGTAMAISGAAANPNMGYHSSPVLSLLMTLFNVRLGWWLGNPGASGSKTWRRSGPRYSVQALFSEAFGNTTDRYKYVNLSDGGHFENLGLYEMVLRRCHYIVVSDAGEDPECSFADLGEAIRKIRIDFGIRIEFGSISIYPRSAIATLKTPGHRCAIGRIYYSEVDGPTAPDGIIVYIKPACYGDEPPDIYEYFKRSDTFPHESTREQFFSESQFESYRMLGLYTMEKLCTDCAGDFSCFIRDILKHLEMKQPLEMKQRLEWLEKSLAGSGTQPAEDVPSPGT